LPVRLLFAGTPEAAVPSLEAIAASRHEILAVLTRPDARAGRGRHARRSPVARWADDHQVPVLSPHSLSEPPALQAIRELASDCAPVVAYGALIRKDALEVPKHGWVNLHFSVLPAWRGAAPVQRALIAGEQVTGATTFRLDAGLDTGPVYGVLTETVRPDDTAGALLQRLSVAGAQLLVATLDGIEDGTLEARPQAADGVSLAAKVTVADARIDWHAPATAIDRLIRACTPEPGAWTTWRGERLGLGPVRAAQRGDAVDSAGPGGAALAPGELDVGKRAVHVGTAGAALLLDQVQPPGRRPMPAADWARGARLEPGERLQ
jgi:methionyl-tRNA formyltransferase